MVSKLLIDNFRNYLMVFDQSSS